MSIPLMHAYNLMRDRFGHQHWWPGDSPFEICVGAILTQNTNWRNVERAIHNLKVNGYLTLLHINNMPHKMLANMIRPAGYYNLKAKRLISFTRKVVEDYDAHIEGFLQIPLYPLRQVLLSIHGIGPETADSILLYAANRESFVIDTYTKRIFIRHGWIDENANYDRIQRICEDAIIKPKDQSLLDYWQDCHAQLVAVGKDYCRPRAPACEQCPLKSLLPR